MALLAEDERMLKNMLMVLNDRCEDYGMKININRTRAMVIGRKPKKVDMRIKDESIEHMDSFKYLWCNISSNLNCCQEVKERIAMTKEAFNRKRSIFCGPLGKELRMRLVKSFPWNVVLYGAETWTLRRNEQKRLEAFEMWIWRRIERVKMERQNNKAVVLERVREGRTMLELIKQRKRNWLGHWLRRNCLLKDALEGMVNGKTVRGRIRYQMIGNTIVNELYEDTKRKAEKRVEWRMLSLQ